MSQWEIHNSKMEDWCREYKGPKFHAVLCDPPYGLSFMNKSWDQMAAHDWAEALKLVLLPGALVFAFGGTRMWHRLACGFEDAGFEMWDTMVWLHGQGFPKAQDISKLIDSGSGVPVEQKISLAVHIRECRLKHEISVEQMMAWFPYKEVVRNWERKDAGNRTPSTHDYQLLIDRIGCSPEFREFVRQENERLVVSRSSNGIGQGWVESGDAGFSKEFNITIPTHPKSVPWYGFKTAALKPAWEPILCFKAPTDSTYAENALTHGSGSLNVDRGRVQGPAGSGVWGSNNATCKPSFNDSPGNNEFRTTQNEAGRYPANVVLDTESAAMLDEQTGVLTSEEPAGVKAGVQLNVYGKYAGGIPLTGYGDAGGASRFFYCAKAGRFERDAGLDDFEKKMLRWSKGEQNPGSFQSDGTDKEARNFHPTVKAIALNKWLAGMLLPPQVVSPRRLLIPFSGSGSEMIGAIKAGWDEVVGIEEDKEYCEIARARVKWWVEHPDFEELQGSLF